MTKDYQIKRLWANKKRVKKSKKPRNKNKKKKERGENRKMNKWLENGLKLTTL